MATDHDLATLNTLAQALSRSVDLAAANFPANHISGDFYNWFELPDGRVAVVIGDVTGHGMSAAFLMATTQLLVRTTMQRVTDPAACLEEVNRQLCTLVFNEQFVTLQILVLDPDGGPVEDRHQVAAVQRLGEAEVAVQVDLVPAVTDPLDRGGRLEPAHQFSRSGRRASTRPARF